VRVTVSVAVSMTEIVPLFWFGTYASGAAIACAQAIESSNIDVRRPLNDFASTANLHAGAGKKFFARRRGEFIYTKNEDWVRIIRALSRSTDKRTRAAQPP
jgi:hypothetical protein